MKINQIRFALFFIALSFMMACNPPQEIPGVDKGFIDESLLEPVDISFEEMEGESLQLMGERDEACKYLGRIRRIARQGDCQFVIELAGGRFISPINAREISRDLKSGRFVYIGIEKAAEGPCERGIPAFITCISGFEVRKEIERIENIQIGG